MPRISDVMRTDFPQLSADMPIRRAVALLLEADAVAAPVLDEAGGLVGILTQKDCFRPALMASYYQEWTGSVADHMTPSPHVMQGEDDLVSAAETFALEPHRVYPVLSAGRLVGMLRRRDVLAALVRLGG